MGKARTGSAKLDAAEESNLMIYVCPLSKVGETVATTGAARLISLLAAGTEMTRPDTI